MKNILIFASLAGIAAAVAIYFVGEGNKGSGNLRYVGDAAKDEFDRKTSVSELGNSAATGYNAMT